VSPSSLNNPVIITIHIMTTPATPPPLRQRRNFNLSTQIPPSSYEANFGTDLALTNLPRRKSATDGLAAPKIAIEGEQKDELDRCWGQIGPDIFVAFHEETDDKVFIVEGGRKYTHVITISLAPVAGAQEMSTDLSDGSCVHALHLSVRCPAEDASIRVRRAGLGLSVDQLKSTSVFLSNAFSSMSSPTVLITCLRGRQTDVISVIATHLSRSLEEDVTEILKVIDLIDDLSSVWKGEVSEDEVRVIQSVLDGCTSSTI